MRYHGAHIQLTCEGRGRLVPLNKQIFTLLWEYGVVRVLNCFDVDPIRGMLALPCSYKVNFDMKDGAEWFSYNPDESVVSRVSIYEGKI